MITVTLIRDNKQAITGFMVNGHAYAAPPGQDIVCAGVSALTQSAVMGIERHLRREIDLVQDRSGLMVELISQPDSLTTAVFETMLLGLTEIARLYPKRVRIIEHRR
ncbi:ribosomal-processing cysteine protease Prp [Sporomusa termitida]|uniref:Ribosomal processing cysteine protease Prp n=1 Tax=Sporomusa termitida TaxID=2377 RepID=A0A517DS66_9FIRM|nr:ribosomal-processing cysteine protease Prp [Sporomusa termitida]QDR80136.1 Cysteine protease Prp [Sporomusa termitida]